MLMSNTAGLIIGSGLILATMDLFLDIDKKHKVKVKEVVV